MDFLSKNCEILERESRRPKISNEKKLRKLEFYTLSYVLYNMIDEPRKSKVWYVNKNILLDNWFSPNTWFIRNYNDKCLQMSYFSMVIKC